MWHGAPLQPHHTTHNTHNQEEHPPPSPLLLGRLLTMTSAPLTTYYDDYDDDYNVDDVDWEAEARVIQNRGSRVVGTTDREARLFREFF